MTVKPYIDTLLAEIDQLKADNAALRVTLETLLDDAVQYPPFEGKDRAVDYVKAVTDAVKVS